MRVELCISTWIFVGASLLSACGSSDSNEGGNGDGGADGGASGTGGGTGSGGRATGGRSGTGGRATGGGPATGGTPAADGGDGSTGAAPGDGGGTGGNPGSDGSTGTGGNTGADGSTGTGGTGAGGATGNACDALAGCCPTAGIFQASCGQIVATGQTAQCSAVQSLFCGDSGVIPGVDAGAACATLDGCCATQSGPTRTQCDQIVSIGVELACAQLQLALCP